MKPFELLAISAGCGLMIFLIVMLTLQNLMIALIGFGVAFIVTIVVLAMLVLSFRPNPEAPVYLDRQLAESKEPGAAEAALRVDVEATVGGDAPRERTAQEIAEEERAAERRRRAAEQAASADAAAGDDARSSGGERAGE